MNVGILGHVDSGKTTFVRAISSLHSTNALDAHVKTSHDRANTIDLGFSCLELPNGRRLALIDCPGHAALMKAVLAASQVFDAAVVLLDAARGVERQTAEHLLLASLLVPSRVLVVVNKIDLVDEEKQQSSVKKLPKQLMALGIDPKTPIVSVSLKERTEETTKRLKEALENLTAFEPRRESSGKLVMAIDHCFAITGKGVVATGTVLDGEVRVGMEIEFPTLGERRRVKSMQSWKANVERVAQGGRAAILLAPTLDVSRVSRQLISEPGALQPLKNFLVTLKAISHFRKSLSSNVKLHVSTGFDTVLAECQFLSEAGGEETELEWLGEMNDRTSLCYMKLERTIYARLGDFYIASRLDQQGSGCRFAFYGKVLKTVDDEAKLKEAVCSKGQRTGREAPSAPETKMSLFEGMPARLSTGEQAKIEGSFGKSGKARISISGGLKKESLDKIARGEEVRVHLWLKKYLHDHTIKARLPSLEELEQVDVV